MNPKVDPLIDIYPCFRLRVGGVCLRLGREM